MAAPGYVRFMFAIMVCVANMIIYGSKVNIATTILGMVKKKDPINGTSDVSVECPEFEEETSTGVDFDGPYDWSTTEQGLLVSIYFAGYLIGMFPSGYFADRFNAKWVLLICVFSNALLTLAVPWAAAVLPLLYILRFFTGLLSAANLPVVNVLVGQWVIYEEKSLWAAIIYSGTSLGTVISILTSGLIMSKLGWEAVFYIHGALPFVWCAVFYFFFADSPENQKFITEEERQALCSSYGHRSPRGSTTAKKSIPWKAIFTSVPFWALLVTNTLGNFCWYFLLMELPIYMNKMLRYKISQNAMLGCLPYLINSVTNPLLGKLLDWGRNKGYWSQTGGRKIAVAYSSIPPSIFLIIIMYLGCDRTGTTILLLLSIVMSGAIFVGHLINQNDLAPNYAGILMGITNTPGTISAFLLPWLVGVLVEGGHTFANWRSAFWIVIVSQLLAVGTFMVFGSAKIQPWNEPDYEENRQAGRQRKDKQEMKSLMKTT